jgi:hypothetical protein
MPSGALGTSLLQGSSALASVSGAHVTVQGPFPPGETFVQVGCELPATSGTLDLTQRFPAPLDQLAVVVKKVGEAKLASPNIRVQQDMPSDGDVFIAASGGSVAANQPITLTLTDLPHHNLAGRWIALALAVAIIGIGAWAATRDASGDEDGQAAEQKRLAARREKLFAELVKLEREHRLGRIDGVRYGARREELVSALEGVYGALDSSVAA